MLIERRTMISDLCKGDGAGGGGEGGGGGLVPVVAMTQILGQVLTKFVVVHDHLIVIQRRLVIKSPASTV